MRTLLLLALTACATNDTPPIDHGIYGRVLAGDDEGAYDPSALADVAVTAYLADNPVADTTSDIDGDFALELGAGTYVVCVQDAGPATLAAQRDRNCAGKCTRVEVSAEPVRANWGANLSGGLWDAGDYCP